MGTFSPAATARNPDAISVCFEVRRPLEENFGLENKDPKDCKDCKDNSFDVLSVLDVLGVLAVLAPAFLPRRLLPAGARRRLLI